MISDGSSWFNMLYDDQPDFICLDGFDRWFSDDLRWFIFRGQTGQGELHTNLEESLRCNTIHALHAGPMEVHIKGRDCILSNPQLLALMDAITVENWWQLLRSHRNGGIPAEAAGGIEQADQAQSSAKKCLLCWLYVLRGLLCMDLLNLRLSLVQIAMIVWRQLGIHSLKQSFKSKHGMASPFQVGSEPTETERWRSY